MPSWTSQSAAALSKRRVLCLPGSSCGGGGARGSDGASGPDPAETPSLGMACCAGCAALAALRWLPCCVPTRRVPGLLQPLQSCSALSGR